MKDPAHQREAIIGLTHTEIMLILVVVILLLLLAKDFQLKGERAQNSTTLSLTETVPPDGNDPVDKPLSPNGTGTSEDNGTKNKMPTRPDPKPDGNDPVDKPLSPDGTGIPETNKAKDEPLSEPDAPPKPTSSPSVPSTASVDEPLTPDGTDDPEIDREEIDKLQSENEKLREENAELTEQLKLIKQKKSLRDKVGFVPCWPGNGDGKPWYYFAYKITYDPDSGTFRIDRHKDWASKNDTVHKDVNGRLSRLKEYPQGHISSQKLLSFAQSLDQQKRNIHGKECYLAVTINKKDVDGIVIEFLRDKARFYPIY